MDIEKLLEITQTLELSVDEFYKAEEEKLEELKNMPYALARESYASTKQIIDNREDTYSLIDDLKNRLSEVRELDESRTQTINLNDVADEIVEEDLEDYEEEPRLPRMIRRVSDKPKLRRFLLADSSVMRLNYNGDLRIENDDLEEIISEEKIDNDMEEIKRIKSELEMDHSDLVSETTTEVVQEDVSEDDGYYGFIDATAVLEAVDNKKDEEKEIDLDKTLYLEKHHFSPKIRAIGLPDKQLKDIINSNVAEKGALMFLNERALSKEENVDFDSSKESTDIFTNSFDEAFQKAMDVEPKRRIDRNKISEREKALKELSQME